jgi:hypothetical protein
MTTQVKKTIEATDIVAVEVECSGCHFRATWPLEAWNSSFKKCSNCGLQWPIAHHQAHDALTELVRNLCDVVRVKNEADIPFSIRFELAESKEKL